MEYDENELIQPERVAWNLCNFFGDEVEEMIEEFAQVVS